MSFEVLLRLVIIGLGEGPQFAQSPTGAGKVGFELRLFLCLSLGATAAQRLLGTGSCRHSRWVWWNREEVCSQRNIAGYPQLAWLALSLSM